DGRIVLEPIAERSATEAASAADGEHVKSGESAETAVYLRSLHAAEAGVASLVELLLTTPARPITIDVERALVWFEDRAKIALAGEQREAIRRAIAEKVLVVTGGPGT